MQSPEPTPPSDREIGRRMAEIREEVLQMKQDQLAKILGMAVSTLSRYEQGKASFPLEAVIRVSMMARVSLDWLLRPQGVDRVWAVDLEHIAAAKRDMQAPDVRKEPLWRSLRRQSQIRRSVTEMQDLWKEITGDDAHPDWF